MALELTPDKIMAAVAVLGMLGGIFGWILHNRDNAQQKDMKDLKDRMEKDLKDLKDRMTIEKTQLEDARVRDNVTFEKEVARLQDSARAAWAMIDRLKEERSRYWTHTDHERWRAEMKSDFKADIEEMGQRLVAEVEKIAVEFRTEIRNLKDKVEK